MVVLGAIVFEDYMLFSSQITVLLLASIIVPNVKTRQYRTVHTLLQLVQQLSSYIYRDHV